MAEDGQNRTPAGEATVETTLDWLETHARDSRPHVTKAISMAVRAIGKRNASLRALDLDWTDRLDGRDRAQARLAREVRRELAKAAR